MIGESLRGRQFDKRKAKLFIFIFLGFLFGGTAGAALFSAYELYALVFPALLAFVIAIAYWGYLYLLSRKQTV
jgi:uncharacterized membrane protein YoaK (UPF0700 family)